MQIRIIIKGRDQEQTGKCLASLEEDLRHFSSGGIETFLVCQPGSLNSHDLPAFASLAPLQPGENWYQAVNRLASLPFAENGTVSESGTITSHYARDNKDSKSGFSSSCPAGISPADVLARFPADPARTASCKPAGSSLEHLLFLLDASVCLEPGALPAMLDCLEQNPEIYGVNPLFFTPDRARLVSAGTVVDSVGQLHCLYAGLPCQNNDQASWPGIRRNDASSDENGNADLAGRQRFFQVAAGACLLLRLPSFLDAGGLRSDLGQLAVPDLCKRLATLPDQQASCQKAIEQNRLNHKQTCRLADHPAPFATEPAAKACLADRYCFWLEYGIWNSLIWRGKLQQDIFVPDHHLHVTADGLEYSCDQWLVEGPDELAQATDPANHKIDSGTRSDHAWWQWQASHEPVHLLAFFGTLSGPELRQAISLCRDIPSSLPRTFAWYKSRAEKLLRFAGQNGLATLASAAKNWLARARRFHHGTLRPAMRLLQKAGIYETSLDNCPAVYDAWIELVEPDWTSAKSLAAWQQAQNSGMRSNTRADNHGQTRPGADKETDNYLYLANNNQGRLLAGSADQGQSQEKAPADPTIAIVMPVWNPEPEHLRAAIDSVLAQKYRNWQLCIADDASTRPEIPVILREYAARESRIRLTFRQENGHICRATNSAIALADADWIAFMDNDDLLTPDALLIVADYIRAKPEARYFFSDEDKIDCDGVRRNAVFRSDNLTRSPLPHGHLTIAASDLVAKVGGCRPGFEGSQDFDFGVCCCHGLAANEICHIPHVLYHWRVHANSTTAGIATKPYLLEATKKILRGYWQNRGQNVQVHETKHNNFFNVALTGQKWRSVSIILINDREPKRSGNTAPNVGNVNYRDICGLLEPALDAQLTKMQKQGNTEFLLDNFYDRQSRSGKSASCLADTMIKMGQIASGEILLFLTTDLLPDRDCEPAQLLALAATGYYSAVGSVLLWPGRKIWHTGLYPDRSGQPFALARGSHDSLLKSMFWGQLLVPHTVLAPAIQGLAIKRSDLLSGDFRPEYGPLALAGYCLTRSKAGLPALVSPWGQWYVDPSRAMEFEAPAELAKLASAATEDQPAWQQAFLRDHGADVANHPLLHPCLKASPDNGWGLVFPEREN